MSKHPKKKTESRSEPLQIDEKRLAELIVKLRGLDRKFHDLWRSDLDVHEKTVKLFEVFDSLESREERYAAFVMFMNIVIMAAQHKTMVELLQAAINDEVGEDDGSNGGSNGNGEPKN